jgi:DNA helicase-2/ATP-dependent DNA helicase PcrA
MGVSAVPGSGKTQTLSSLAALLIAEGCIADDQEVLVVTLVNSAVDNFTSRVRSMLDDRGLLGNLGYRVRTLHGLAHDIVRERPSLVGLESGFQIIDERDAEEILGEVCDAWIRSHPDTADRYIDTGLEERRRDWVRREKWPYVVRDLGRSFIKKSKDLQATPGLIRDTLSSLKLPLLLVEMGLDIYFAYQRALAYRGAVDFDDLIRLALQALTLDDQFLARLQRRWPYVLEDEAQDSSQLQERILRRLVGKNGNWVRVGDPNQAIYETFTTANPKYLREFLQEEGVTARELLNSGRSTPSIISIANTLVRWCRADHPVDEVRDALTPNLIRATPRGDPQPNPIDDPEGIVFVRKKMNPGDELAEIVQSLKRWLPAHPESTTAVLVPRNERGEDLVNLLKTHQLPFVELLRSTRSTREAAGALARIVQYLAEPASPGLLSTGYKVYRRDDRDIQALKPRYERISRLLQKCKQVEAYCHPRSAADWLADLNLEEADPEAYADLVEYRKTLQRWQAASLLPIDQLLLTIAQDLFTDPADLAVASKLAGVLRGMADKHLEWGLPELSKELVAVARNERKFLGFSHEETGFDPDKYPGQVVVLTIHKAKGLEWDRVYLASVNNYDFPSGMAYDQYISEKWFLNGRANLEAEALSQLKALLEKDAIRLYEPMDATQQARIDYASERLRLLYVGITRARRQLIVSWNTGRNGDLTPAVPFIAIQESWEASRHAVES